MEDDIKFRAWDKKGKRMFIPSTENNNTAYFTGFDKLGFIVCKSENTEYPLMQCTGLKDKKGKEIYFSDIVKFTFKDMNDTEEDQTQMGTALITKTMNGGAGIMFDFEGDLYDGHEVWACSEGGITEDIWEDESLWDMEVIGNVYENPNLIKND